MKKKVFFIVGLLLSAVAASFFIPLQNGQYWWSASSEIPEIVIVDGDRIPAGGPQNGPYYAPEEDTTYEAPQEETPVYSGGKDKPPTPVYETPKPTYEAPAAMNCLRAALTEPSQRPSGQKFGSKNWIRNMRMSDAYLNSFIVLSNGKFTAAAKRRAITSIVAAGYCPGKDYQSASPLRPMIQKSSYEMSIDDRASAYRADPKAKYIMCSQKANLIEYIRKDICEKMYQVCGIRQYSDRDCYMGDKPSRDDHGGNNNGGHTGGHNTGGGNSGGEHEVGNGSNESSGHGANSDGAQGDGPPGASR